MTKINATAADRAAAARALVLSAMMDAESASVAAINEMLEANAPGIGDNKGPAFADVYAAAEACQDYAKAIELSASLAASANATGELAKQNQLRWWIGTASALARINFDVKDDAKCAEVVKARWPSIDSALKARVAWLRLYVRAAKSGMLRGTVDAVMRNYQGGESLENNVYAVLVEAKRIAAEKGNKTEALAPLSPSKVEDVMSGKLATKRAADAAASRDAKKAEKATQVSAESIVMTLAREIADKEGVEADVAHLVALFKTKLEAAIAERTPVTSAKKLQAKKAK